MLFFKRFKPLHIPGWVDDILGMIDALVTVSLGIIAGLITAKDTPELVDKVQQIGSDSLIVMGFAILLVVIIVRAGTTVREDR